MSDAPHDSSRLHSDLAQMRAALSKLEAPLPDEEALRAQFRESERQRARKIAAERTGASRRYPLAAAAAVALAVGGALTAGELRGERSASTASTAAVEAPAEPLAVGAFQPLSSSPALSPSSSYSVVRVRIPLSAFAVVPGTQQDGSIEADLLVGEDGLARAIRFNEADAARVSVADQ
jgi:hypothetical protein